MLADSMKVWHLIEECSKDASAEAGSGRALAVDSRSPPHVVYLNLCHAVRHGRAEQAEAMMKALAVAPQAEADLVVAGLKTAHSLLPSLLVDQVIDRLIVETVRPDAFARTWEAWLELLPLASDAVHPILCKKILSSLHPEAHLPTQSLTRLLAFLLETELTQSSTPAIILYRAALKRLDNFAVRVAVIRLHLRAPKVFSFEESIWKHFEQNFAADPRTAFLLGLCHDRRGLPKSALSYLRIGLPVVGRHVESARAIFEVAARSDDRELALWCARHLATCGAVDSQTIRILAPWAARLDLAPHWQEILESAANRARSVAEVAQIQTLLCEALFRADRRREAIDRYFKLPNREFADIGLRMRVIETLIEQGRGEVAVKELEEIPEVTREHRIHVLSLRLRAADQTGKLDEHRRLIQKAPADYFDDPSIKIELAWQHFRDQEWGRLYRLLRQGPLQHPVLQSFRLVAAAQNREYQVVRSELARTPLELPAPYGWLRGSLSRPLAAAGLYSFAVAGQWSRLGELLSEVQFEDPDDPIPTFYRYLTSIYGHLEQRTEPTESWRPICDAFEQLLILSSESVELELLVALIPRSPLADPSSCPDPKRARELVAYLQFLMLARIEELVPRIESRHLEAARDIRGRLQDSTDLRVTLALLLRAEDLNDGG